MLSFGCRWLLRLRLGRVLIPYDHRDPPIGRRVRVVLIVEALIGETTHLDNAAMRHSILFHQAARGIGAFSFGEAAAAAEPVDPGNGERAVVPTVAPPAAKRRTIASPTPLLPPVTKTRFPANSAALMNSNIALTLPNDKNARKSKVHTKR